MINPGPAMVSHRSHSGVPPDPERRQPTGLPNDHQLQPGDRSPLEPSQSTTPEGQWHRSPQRSSPPDIGPRHNARSVCATPTPPADPQRADPELAPCADRYPPLEPHTPDTPPHQQSSQPRSTPRRRPRSGRTPRSHPSLAAQSRSNYRQRSPEVSHQLLSRQPQQWRDLRRARRTPIEPARRSPQPSVHRVEPDFLALRVNVGFGVAGTGWRVMLAGVLGLGSWWGW